MKKIFMYETVRELLIFLLIRNTNEEIIWVYMDDMPFIENLVGEKIRIKRGDFTHKNKKVNKLKRKIFAIKNRFYLKWKLGSMSLGNYDIYGYEHTQLGYILKKTKLSIIEDGFLNYIQMKELKKTAKSKYIKKIYLTKELLEKFGYLEEVNKQELEKIEVVSIEEIWNKKSPEEKKKIMQIFEFDPQILEELKGYESILITQSLSEDGFIEEKEKIELYKGMIKNEKIDKIIIKPHPRERTDYKKYFPEAYILKGRYPVEFFSLNNFKINRAVTMFSTGVLGVGKGVDVSFYGTEICSKIYDFFGTMDGIIKRNKFLKFVGGKMIGEKKILAVIPARGGSKGIPYKNIIDVYGKPLLYYSIECAKKSKYIDRLIVSTDCEKIRSIAEKMGGGSISPFLRPAEISQDESKTIDTLIHAIKWLKENENEEYDYIVLLQNTTPLRKSWQIDEAIEKLLLSEEKSLVSVTEVEENPVLMRTLEKDGTLKNLLNIGSTIRRQDFPKFYRVNGAIYIYKIDKDFNLNTSLNDGKLAYIMEGKYSVDIDTILDIKKVEFYMEKEIEEIQKREI